MSLRKPKGKYEEADEIYDSFKTKDMSRTKFRKEYLDLTNPDKFKKDVGGVIAYRQLRQTQGLLAAHKKKEIDSAVSEN